MSDPKLTMKSQYPPVHHPVRVFCRFCFTTVVVCLVFCAGCGVKALPHGRTLTIDLIDPKPLVSRSIENVLLLRIIKESTVLHEHFGWKIEIVPIPSHTDAENLVYTNPDGLGPDPSMIFAWHVMELYYPDARNLSVRGYPYIVHVRLEDPQVRGKGENAAFLSGKLLISWERQAGHNYDGAQTPTVQRSKPSK